MSVERAGGPARLVSTGRGDVLAVFADGASSYVYWSAVTTDSGPDGVTTATISRAPKSGGIAEVLVADFDPAPYAKGVLVGACDVVWATADRKILRIAK